MARPLRIQIPGLTYHVTARGTARMAIYLDDTDRRRFLAVFTRVADAFRLECHAYCLMSNHYHLALTTTEANLSRAIKHLNGTYAQWWNRRHGRVGHVFQGRFGAQIVQDNRYLLAVCRYIVLNPVRAHLAGTPDEWCWSSYRATARLAEAPPFLRCDLLLGCIDNADRGRAVLRYREFITEPTADGLRLPGGPVLGDDQFVERFKTLRARASPEVPWCERQERRPLVALFEGAITAARRNAAVVEARRHGYTLARIAGYLELHPSTISKILGRADAGSDREEG